MLNLNLIFLKITMFSSENKKHTYMGFILNSMWLFRLTLEKHMTRVWFFLSLVFNWRQKSFLFLLLLLTCKHSTIKTINGRIGDSIRWCFNSSQRNIARPQRAISLEKQNRSFFFCISFEISYRDSSIASFCDALIKSLIIIRFNAVRSIVVGRNSVSLFDRTSNCSKWLGKQTRPLRIVNASTLGIW